MWKCESGCLESYEREYETYERVEGDEKRQRVVKKQTLWRPRAGVPLQAPGKSEHYASTILCTDCQNMLDAFVVELPEWAKLRKVRQEANRMEIEGRGASLDPGWEAKCDEAYDILRKIRGIILKWCADRREAVLMENKARGASESKAPSWD